MGLVKAGSTAFNAGQMVGQQEAAASFTTPKDPLNGPMVGGLMHDAAEITAALIMAHGINRIDAIETFEAVLRGVLKVREKIG